MNMAQKVVLSTPSFWTEGTSTASIPNNLVIGGNSAWFGNFTAEAGQVEVQIKKDKNIPAKIYFKLVKNKLNKIDGAVLEKKLQKLEKATEKLMDQGQNALAERFLNDITVATKELQAYTAGVRYYIDKDVLWKHKNKIRGGHISNTKYEDFMRKIPDDVVEAKKKVDGIFDEYWIFHYHSNEADNNKEMTPTEKARMRDPILFGVFREKQRFYLIADWIDDECDFTFDQIVEALAGEDDDFEYKLDGKVKVGDEVI